MTTLFLNNKTQKMTFIYLFALLFQIHTSIISCNGSNNPPIVETNSGKISGVFKKSYSENEYMAYLGIPYAESPTGRKS